MLNTRFWVLVAITFTLGLARIIPHPWNFTPVTAMALFAGAYFSSKRAALAVPLLAVVLGDLALNRIHWGMTVEAFSILPVNYVCFALIVTLGFWMRQSRTFARIAASTLLASLFYFLVTNFTFWLLYPVPLYTRDLPGLVDCYYEGIRFFRMMLAGDMLYSTLLFGGFALVENAVPKLREPRMEVAQG